MPTSVEEVLELLDLEVIEDNLFRGRQPNTSLQRVFGGQVAAQSLVAATRTVDPKYVVHSLHSYFLRPGDPSVPIVYEVEDIRNGRSFATRRVLARQHGRPIYGLTCDFQIPEEGLDHQDVMPAVPTPEDCPDIAQLAVRDPSQWEAEWSALDIRWAGDSVNGGAVPDPGRAVTSRLWIRTNGALPDDRQTQTAAFTYASDLTLLAASLLPHGIPISSSRIQAASLDHTVWFHRPFRADEWWLYEQSSPSASGGRGLSIARVFAQDGRLVASVAQEGLIRVIR